MDQLIKIVSLCMFWVLNVCSPICVCGMIFIVWQKVLLLNQLKGKKNISQHLVICFIINFSFTHYCSDIKNGIQN